jgi:hypothetical protein
VLICFLLVECECERSHNYGDNGETSVRFPVFPWIIIGAAGEQGRFEVEGTAWLLGNRRVTVGTSFDAISIVVVVNPYQTLLSYFPSYQSLSSVKSIPLPLPGPLLIRSV